MQLMQLLAAGAWLLASALFVNDAIAETRFIIVPDSASAFVEAVPSGGPAAATKLAARDLPDDSGRRIEVTWRPSAEDTPGGGRVKGYRIERGLDPAGPWAVVDSAAAGDSVRVDASVRRDTPFFYRVVTLGESAATPSFSVAGPVTARSQWIHSGRLSVLAFTLAFFALVLFFTDRSQRGARPFVRRIPGIDAIEEAIGRATEMGRPVLYVPGILDIDELQTVAGLVILESVSRITARYQTPIRVPVTYPIPFAIAQEMVKSGYLNAGRPEDYDPDSVRFVSPEQFAYVASVSGMMMRDRPAAHIFMGAFYAESLLLAEVGFANGAIQVAGTANVHQIPFFVVACDYTLIGEEMFAASAYLSGEPRLVGSLKATDYMKVAVVVVILVGCVLEGTGFHGLSQWMATQ